MKTLLLLNDFSPEAEHALAYTLVFAENLNAKVLVCNIKPLASVKTEKQMVMAASNQITSNAPLNAAEDAEPKRNKWDELRAEVMFLPEADFINGGLHQIVIKQNIDLIIQGVSGELKKMEAAAWPILSKTFCPLLLVSMNAPLTKCNNMAYMTDLRYCREEMLNAIIRIGKPLKSNMTIAHLSASGLPNLAENYALQLFDENINRKHPSNSFTFNNTKARDAKKAADVLIHAMNVDILAVIYRQSHFNDLISGASMIKEVDPFPIPLLLFPS